MKNFRKLNLNEIRNVMNKSEMKKILAGSGSGSGSSGSCCGHTSDWSLKQCGISKTEAQYWPMWCCASCP